MTIFAFILMLLALGLFYARKKSMFSDEQLELGARIVQIVLLIAGIFLIVIVLLNGDPSAYEETDFAGGLDEMKEASNNASAWIIRSLSWAIYLVIAAGVLAVVWGIVSFILRLIDHTKEALPHFIGFIIFALLLVVTWVMGSSGYSDSWSPLFLENLIKDGVEEGSWNIQIGDMMLFSSYVLVVIAVLTIIWGSVVKLIK